MLLRLLEFISHCPPCEVFTRARYPFERASGREVPDLRGTQRARLWVSSVWVGSDRSVFILLSIYMLLAETLQTMAKRFLAFDMKILYHNRKPISPAPSFPCTYCANMDDLLSQSDIVSINMPLNESTRGSFGKAQFDKMKDGSVLVNTARGAVVDEDAMIAALESGKVSPTA